MTRRTLLMAPLARGAYFPPPDAGGGWRSSPKEARVDAARLDDAYRFVQTTTKHGGLLVARNGWLAYERYFGRGHREATANLASCGKSYTSVSVGILLDEKRDIFPRGLDTLVYTGGYLPQPPDDDPRRKAIRLGHLLAMSGGIRGNNPSYVRRKEVMLDPPGPDGWPASTDKNALATGMWCAPGEGYSYATASIHIASIVLRRAAGMELQPYVKKHIAEPLGWGRWGWAYRRPEVDHTPGGGGIAVRPSDMLRFAYLLLHQGQWDGRQIIPRAYVKQCGTLTPYNPHYDYSFQFDVNTNGKIPTAPRDAFWKTGSGGHCLFVVPSLNLVAFKLGGRDDQYSPSNTGIQPPYQYDGSRESWKAPGDLSNMYSKTLELIVAAVRS